MRIRRGVSLALVLLGIVYAYGALLGGMAWLSSWLEGRPTPGYAWWQYLLVPLGLGIGAMALEGVFERLQRATGFGALGHSRLRRLLELLLLFIVLATVILGPVLYGMSRQ